MRRRSTTVSLALLVVELSARGVAAQGNAPLRAALTGTVYDSVHRAPLANASVVLANTALAAQTDHAGHYRFDSLSAGHYTVTFFHPFLDSLGVSAPSRVVTLSPDGTTTADLAVPTTLAIVEAVCGRGAPGASATLALGIVRDADSGVPIPGATVMFGWMEYAYRRKVGIERAIRSANVITDSAGSYRYCGIPVDVLVAVQAQSGVRLSGPVELRMDGARLAQLDIGVSPTQGLHVADDRVGETRQADGPAPRPRTASVSGVVTGSDNRVLRDATVVLLGAAGTARTDSAGEFRIASLPAGSHTLEVRRIGFVPSHATVHLRPGRTARVRLHLTQPVVLLDSVRVLTDRVVRVDQTRGFEDRRRREHGVFIDRREIDRRAPTETADLLRGIPGVSERFTQTAGTMAVSDRGARSIYGDKGVCATTVYLDGLLIPETLNGATDLDRWIKPREIEAIEVYAGPSQTPAEFNRPVSACGVVLIWSREPDAFAPRRPRPSADNK